MMDLLAGLRLSRHIGDLDPSTSPRQQRADITEYAADVRARVTIWAEDLDVSAITLSPFERPGIGPWLTPERQHHYQGIIFAHADRGVRSMMDLSALSQFAIKYRKVIYFVTGVHGGPFVLDYRNGPEDPMVQLMAYLFAFAAEMEANRILSRNRKSKKFLVSNGFWTGGRHLFYLTPTKVDGENNQRLILNPDLVRFAEEMVEMGLDGVPAETIAEWLNFKNIPAPKEAEIERAKEREKSQSRGVSQAPVDGMVTAIEDIHITITGTDGQEYKIEKSPRKGRWSVNLGDPVATGDRLIHKMVWHGGTVTRTLRSKTLYGETPYDDKLVRGLDAAPVQRAEPLITREKWERLQNALDNPKRSRRKYRGRKDSLLLDVAYCGHCNSDLYASRDNRKGDDVEFGYYRCAKKTIPKARQAIEGTCVAKGIRISALNEVVENLLLDTIGPYERMARIFVPGISYTAELEETKIQLRKAIKLATGNKSAEVAEIHAEEISALEDRIDYLSKAPTTEAGYEMRSVGTTYAEDWAKQSVADRRMMLIEAGIAVYAMTTEDSPDWSKIPLAPDSDIIRFSQQDRVSVAMVIPKDITHRAFGKEVDLGYRDKTIWEAQTQALA